MSQQHQHDTPAPRPMVFIAIPDRENNRYLVVMAKACGPHEYRIEEPVHPQLNFKLGDLVTCWGKTPQGIPIVSRKLTKYEIENHSYLD